MNKHDLNNLKNKWSDLVLRVKLDPVYQIMVYTIVMSIFTIGLVVAAIYTQI